MSIDIARIAELSKIRFTEGELRELETDMASIINLMDSLKTVELPAEASGFEWNLALCELRDDTARDSLPESALTSAAPGGGYKLPRIIE